MFRAGNTICYLDTRGEEDVVRQGMVLEVGERIKISYHNTNGQEIIWVDPSEIELLNSSRCTHNAECGWCDDSGKCIYE
jgi:hypothetical protein